MTRLNYSKMPYVIRVHYSRRLDYYAIKAHCLVTGSSTTMATAGTASQASEIAIQYRVAATRRNGGAL